MKNQEKDKELIKIAQNNKNYPSKNFYEENKKYSLKLQNCDLQTIRKTRCRVVPQYIMLLQRNMFRAKYFSTLLLEKLCESVHEVCTECKQLGKRLP